MNTADLLHLSEAKGLARVMSSSENKTQFKTVLARVAINVKEIASFPSQQIPSVNTGKNIVYSEQPDSKETLAQAELGMSNKSERS